MKTRTLLSLLAGCSLVTASAFNREIRIPVPAEPTAALTAPQSLPSRLAPATVQVRQKVTPALTETGAPVFDLPFSDNFSDGDATKANYTFIDLDDDCIVRGESAVYNKWFWKADEKLIQFCVDQENPVPGNDWLMTPGLRLNGKNTYKLAIMVNMGRPSNLRVTVGKSLDPADHTTVLLDLNNITSGWIDVYNAEFSVTEEGVYYIGLYNYTNEDGFYFNLFSIDVVEGESAYKPAAPEQFEAVAGENGSNDVNLSFIAPAVLLTGSPITENILMTVERDGSVIKQMECTPGEKVELTDENVSSGEHTYTVYGTFDDVKGQSSSVTLWVGEDLPAVPVVTKFVTQNRNMDVHLEWNAVTEGLNGKYINPATITYNVYRGSDRNNMVAIATGLTALEYTDTDLSWALGDFQDSFFYGITAENPVGETQSVADIISVGKPYTLPAYESFSNGRLDLNPWLTDPISGSFGWSVVTTSSGMDGHDNDNGLTMFYDPYCGWETTDSRLVSPVFSLEGSAIPTLSFWMYHWLDSSVAYESSTRMFPEIRVDNGEWIPLCDPILAATPEWGWIEHKFNLEAYKDAEIVQFGFRGLTDVSWMYFYFDQISVEDAPANDMQITSFYGSQNGAIEEDMLYGIEYYNHGTEPAKDYVIEFLADGNVVWSTYGEELASGEKGSVVANHSFNAAETGEHQVMARIVYDIDANNSNNESQTLVVNISKSFFPEVSILSGENAADGSVLLTWGAPVLPDPTESVVDGAEEYEPWLINGIGDWITVDGDGLGSGYYIEMPHKWPNCEANQAFIVWAPDEEILATFPYLAPYSGDQCFVSWLAVVSDFWNDPVNNDWLISPEVIGGTKIKFMVKNLSTVDQDDTYEVLYSTTGRNVDDFALLTSGTATSNWVAVEAELPANARYFAIRYTGSFQSGLMVDDIEYTPITGLLEIEGYEVFRNAVKLTDTPVTETTFIDNTASVGNNYYSVAVVYDRGRSNACDPVKVVTTSVATPETDNNVTVYAADGSLVVKTSAAVDVAVYTADGTEVFTGVVNGERTVSLSRGIYLVRAGSQIVKVVL